MCTIYVKHNNFVQLLHFRRKCAFLFLIFATFNLSMSKAEEKRVQYERIENEMRGWKTCFMNGTTTIDSREFFISSVEDHGMQELLIENNKKIFFLSKNIDKKYPTLLKIGGSSCSIKSISSGVFDNLIALKWLYLDYNRIEEIENNTFKDLKSVELLSLSEFSRKV